MIPYLGIFILAHSRICFCSVQNIVPVRISIFSGC